MQTCQPMLGSVATAMTIAWIWTDSGHTHAPLLCLEIQGEHTIC